MRLALITVLAGTLGCPANVVPVMPTICPGAPVAVQRYLVPGEPARVSFGIRHLCSDGQGIRQADEVKVTVLDPDGQPVALDSSKLDLSNPGMSLVTVGFTPNRPGKWHVSAKFEPSLGQSQQDIEAVEWHGAAPVRVVSWSETACERYEVTSSGTAFCARTDENNAVELRTVNGQRWSVGGYALAGSSLWTLSTSGMIERMLDVDGGFRSTHVAFAGMTLSSPIAAHGEDAWAFGDPGMANLAELIRFHPESDGGLTQSITHLGPDARGQITASDEGLLIVPNTSPDVRFVGYDGGVSSAQIRNGNLFAEGSSLWVLNDDGLAGFGIKDHTLEEGRLVLPRDVSGIELFLPFPRAVPLIPMFQVDGGERNSVLWVVPRLENGVISLENYDAGADYFPISGANDTHVFARSRNGTRLKIFDR